MARRVRSHDEVRDGNWHLVNSTGVCHLGTDPWSHSPPGHFSDYHLVFIRGRCLQAEAPRSLRIRRYRRNHLWTYRSRSCFCRLLSTMDICCSIWSSWSLNRPQCDLASWNMHCGICSSVSNYGLSCIQCQNSEQDELARMGGDDQHCSSGYICTSTVACSERR